MTDETTEPVDPAEPDAEPEKQLAEGELDDEAVRRAEHPEEFEDEQPATETAETDEQPATPPTE